MEKKKPIISINPPPKDLRCECCNRPLKELSRFPKGEILMKTFREFSGCVGASWECYDCIGLNSEEYIKKGNEDEFTAIVKEKINKINKSKG